MMLDDIIDIHSHSLWDLDDGSGSFRESMEMCLCAEENGTDVLFLTPHLMYWESAEELYDLRNERARILEDELAENGSSLQIKTGFEILCDDDIFSIKHFAPYTLANSRYILIEFSFTSTAEADVISWCKYLQSFGLVPVIAHPERYVFVHDDPECLNRLSDMGVLFQINAGSPAGDFGEAEMNISLAMLNNGFADFIGSDAHNVRGRDTDMSAMIEDYPVNYDSHLLKLAATENPQYILKDKIFVPNRKKYMSKL